jgi:hypothetical protein
MRRISIAVATRTTQWAKFSKVPGDVSDPGFRVSGVTCCRGATLNIALAAGHRLPGPVSVPFSGCTTVRRVISRKRTFPGKAPQPKPRVLLPPAYHELSLLTARSASPLVGTRLSRLGKDNNPSQRRQITVRPPVLGELDTRPPRCAAASEQRVRWT